MYAVVLYFDSETENSIKRLWRGLSENGISDYAYEVHNRRPHITIADYSDLCESEYERKFKQYCNSMPRMSVKLSTLGTFIKSGALFLSPTPSFELIQFHIHFHNFFKAFTTFSNTMYRPDNWIPHCTIANRLNPQMLKEALNYCTHQLETIHAEIQEISFIKVQQLDPTSITVNTILTRNLI